jgi:hypothetical protein
MRNRISVGVTLVSLAAATLFLSISTIGAQAPPAGDHTAHLKAWDAHKTLAQSSPYKAMNWSYIGPTNISGRMTDVAVSDHGSSRRLYAGSCCGGVWASDDLGQTWQPVFDQQASTSTGALAVAPRILTFSGWVPASRTFSAARTRESVSTSRPTTRRPFSTWA